MAGSFPIRLGISRCLLGDPVRYDGGHKRDRFLTDVLGRCVEWVPVCPEVEAGLGVPREPMQLVGNPKSPRLLTITTRRNLTKQLKSFWAHKVKEIAALNLSGYVFKARSPSCGLDHVPVYDGKGTARPNGIGLFARAFQKKFPLMPITDEACLADPAVRERFLEQVFEHHRRKLSARTSVARRATAQSRKAARLRRRTHES